MALLSHTLQTIPLWQQGGNYLRKDISLANIVKRGNSYMFRVSCGYDTNGKQIIRQKKTWVPDKNMTPKQIEKEVNRQAVLFEEECKNGYQSKAIKFEMFAEEWFAEYAKPNLRNTTYERLLQLRKRIYGAIGHLRMDKITPRQIQFFVNSLSKEGANERTGKPLAPKTICHNLSLISDIFSYAMKMGVVSSNPCSKVTIPKGKAKEKMIYTIEEVTEFLKLLESEPLKYRVFFNLAVFSGFRRGELLGLEWKDVDFENNLISVRRTSCYTAKQGIYTDTTKTKRSQRTIKFPASVMELLKKFKAEQDELARQLDSRWIDSDRLFVRWNGEPMNNNTPYFWFTEFCKENNFRFCDVHSMRHFYASALINEGVDAAAVSSALGHSVVSTTTSIYCHTFQQAQARAGDAIASVLDFSSKSKQGA